MGERQRLAKLIRSDVLFNNTVTLEVMKVDSIPELGTHIKCMGHPKNHVMLIFGACKKESKQCCYLTQLTCTHHYGLLIPKHL